ncbi:MAG: IclR family transcriptional regulator, pca regulon regulatory protein [Rhodospirillaceae bacterium]|nr:IclR family transcriptional regulator, pca regulon regulatory protein [Rhodospirillaceae bacterium]
MSWPNGEDGMVRKARAAAAPAGRRGSESLMVNSVEKALRILRAFDGSRRRLGLSQIAEAAGLDVSTAQRFTYTLLQLGYLRKDEASRLYALSPKNLEFGRRYLQSSELVERAMPYLLHLHQSCGETTNLTLLDGEDIVFVSRFLSRNLFNVDVVVGTRLPAFCTAPGLAMLARLDPGEAEAILRRSDRRAFTAHTVTDVRGILARLATIRSDGFAVACQEVFHGDISVAAPILDAAGRPEGAINLASSTARWTVAQARETYSPMVVAAAASASSKRGIAADPSS